MRLVLAMYAAAARGDVRATVRRRILWGATVTKLEKRLREIVANCALGHGSLRDSELVSDAYRAGQQDERARCLAIEAKAKNDGVDADFSGPRKRVERIEKGRR